MFAASQPSARAAYELAAVGAGALVTAVVMSPAAVESGPVLCPFRRLTGLPCPACGLTRSWVYGAHGDWSQAFVEHPFGLLTMAATVALVVAVVVAAVAKTAMPRPDRLACHPAVRATAAVWAVFAIGRIIWQL